MRRSERRHLVTRNLGALFAVVVFAAGSTPTLVRADGIGRSTLKPRTPALRGALHEGAAPQTAVSSGASAGFTTNAGPTLLERPSAFTEQTLDFAHARGDGARQAVLDGGVSFRDYADFREANEFLGRLKGSITSERDGATTLVSIAFVKSRDVEEEIADTSVEAEQRWTRGALTPYLRGEAAFLDYADVDGVIAEFVNQDDRDRLSLRAQAGVSWKASPLFTLTLGGGVDAKRYREKFDDFGIRRDSISPFPVFGVAMTHERAAFSATYSPMRRVYAESAFAPRWRHALSADGSVTLSDYVKLFVAARIGLDETDFFIASAAEERVVVGGVTVSVGAGSVTCEASHTGRSYDDLELAGVSRDDRKIEYVVSANYPISQDVSLDARVSRLDYQSSLFDVETDQTTAMLGLNWTFAR